MKITTKSWKKYLLFTVLSIAAALGNMGVLYTINRIVSDYFAKKVILPNIYILYFVSSVIMFIACRWIVSIGIIKFTQGLLYKTRKDVLKMVLRSSFDVLQKNKNQVFNGLTTDTNNIVTASISIVDILTNIIVVIFSFIYMGMLSWQLLICMLVLISFTLIIYFFSAKRAQTIFKAAMEQNDKFIRYLNEILLGFKEIVLSPKKGTDILEIHIDKAIRASSILNERAQVNFLNNRIIGQTSFYIFIGLVMLFLGKLIGLQNDVLVNFVFLVLYIWSPIETIVLLIPSLSQARTSLNRLNDLEHQIDLIAPISYTSVDLEPFDQICMKNISFDYSSISGSDADIPFQIGPINFKVQKGNVLFISGGNGSGKTTFINILTGLLQQGNGDIYVNGSLIKATQINSYRSLFAPIFSNFHLFDQFYGISDVNIDKANEYLRLFEIDHKITVRKDQFSTINISTGQRKRLALIYALLEKRPILILDEFAADQDPHFKSKFYKEIIPHLKTEGFTLVVITHDDQYYQSADKLFKMDAGKLFESELENLIL